MNDETQNEQNEQGTRQIMTETEARAHRAQLVHDGELELSSVISKPDPLSGFLGTRKESPPGGGAVGRGKSGLVGGLNSDLGERAMDAATERAQAALAGGASPMSTAMAMGVGAMTELAESFPSPPEPEFPFAVRGAKMYCIYGSHIKRLDMPMTHGAFLYEKPMLNESDCKVGINYNIAPFGACRSNNNQHQRIEIHEADPEDLVPIDVIDDIWVVPDLPLEGRKCIPNLGSKWADAHDGVLVDNKPALTTGCTLSCQYGGIITFLDHGQEGD